ncbi:MAG: NAD(P)-dependent oxidoreductase [Acidimicrobiia bacterium]|nr:NAD(P)-dependent oxidoreductase [Acidimicrobiia bacterium]
MPAVWFEREILTDLRADTASRAVILGPASAYPEDPYRQLSAAQGVVASQHSYTGELMDLAPDLRVIARTGIGYDKVDVAAATKRGIAVCNTPDAPTVSTTEHTIALMMAVAKNLKRSGAEMRKGGSDFYARHVGIELEGLTLGLVGYGRTARRVAIVAGSLGMGTAAFDPYVAVSGFGKTQRVEELEQLAAMSDVLSLHLPLTDESAGLVGPELLAAMKPGAILINTARGGLVDLAALEAALDAGHLFGAGLDVTDPEPLPPEHSLLHRDDVVVTPHVAAGTAGAKRRIFKAAFDQVMQVLDGNRPQHLVNPEVWDPTGEESQ